MPWGSILVSYRNKHGIKQRALAEKLGVDERLLRRWEKGEYQPSAKFVERIRAFLNTAGERDLLSKKRIHCAPGSCIFVLGLPQGAGDAQGPESGLDHIPDIAPQRHCAGMCHVVHAQMLVSHAAHIADANVKRIEARFETEIAGQKLQAAVEYHFHRHFAQPILVAECRTSEAKAGETLSDGIDVERFS